MKNNFYILYNPHAGNGMSEAAANTLKNSGKYEPSTIVSMTDIKSYAEFFAGKEGASVIICGGDGTLNRFLNEIGDVKLGSVYYMASGSGNDFLRDLDISDQTEPICIDKYIENIPVCEVNGKIFKVLNGVGYGIDGYCCQVGDEMKAKKVEKINYTAIAIKGLLGKYKTCGGSITVDSDTRRYKKIWLASGMNGRYYGGGMMPCPTQDRLNGKGIVSTCVFHDTGKLATLMIFPSLFKGEHVKNTKKVDVRSGKKITVEFDSPTPLQIDGEVIKDVTKYSIYYK
ncbi:MAG: diacylglycerol kinase family protein [Clostridia bacterium]|nr:diacylglycerol kinase family protein [Clostridia bacterium]